MSSEQDQTMWGAPLGMARRPRAPLAGLSLVVLLFGACGGGQATVDRVQVRTPPSSVAGAPAPKEGDFAPYVLADPNLTVSNVDFSTAPLVDPGGQALSVFQSSHGITLRLALAEPASVDESVVARSFETRYNDGMAADGIVHWNSSTDVQVDAFAPDGKNTIPSDLLAQIAPDVSVTETGSAALSDPNYEIIASQTAGSPLRVGPSAFVDYIDRQGEHITLGSAAVAPTVQSVLQIETNPDARLIRISNRVVALTPQTSRTSGLAEWVENGTLVTIQTEADTDLQSFVAAARPANPGEQADLRVEVQKAITSEPLIASAAVGSVTIDERERPDGTGTALCVHSDNTTGCGYASGIEPTWASVAVGRNWWIVGLDRSGDALAIGISGGVDVHTATDKSSFQFASVIPAGLDRIHLTVTDASQVGGSGGDTSAHTPVAVVDNDIVRPAA